MQKEIANVDSTKRKKTSSPSYSEKGREGLIFLFMGKGEGGEKEKEKFGKFLNIRKNRVEKKTVPEKEEGEVINPYLAERRREKGRALKD